MYWKEKFLDYLALTAPENLQLWRL